ncbi:type II toxin-antitoxin system RelB/DinJ family antitoxin [Slackia heliotrinireducens]|uniref:type II toxin-antitoxin system RelB/DinJ family antitoxin n=1 Tax=Slackia heliotrinireducens TaxID=84110 RepID=UPI0033146DBD
MEAGTTINVRMPESLKQGGMQVLDRLNVSPTELVRSVYRYLQNEQSLPSCLDIAQDDDMTLYQRRRMLLRSVAGTLELPDGYDFDADKEARIMEKYGDVL